MSLIKFVFHVDNIFGSYMKTQTCMLICPVILLISITSQYVTLFASEMSKKAVHNNKKVYLLFFSARYIFIKTKQSITGTFGITV